ncbi:MAG: DUF2959 family protein [Candidatus Brocadia sp.]|jgi:hypothetical protein
MNMMKYTGEWLQKYKQEKGPTVRNIAGLAAFFIILWGFQSFFPGCATTGPEKKQKAVSSIEEFRKELSKNLNQVTETLAALNQIAKTGEGDLYKPYKNFAKQLERTAENSRSMSKHADNMDMKGKQYFDAWEKELSNIINSELRSKGEKRRVELSSAFNRITSLAQKVQSTYQPFISDLMDIKTALGNDLTATGIVTLKPYITKANENAKTVMVKLQELADEVDRLTNALSSRVGLSVL